MWMATGLACLRNTAQQACAAEDGLEGILTSSARAVTTRGPPALQFMMELNPATHASAPGQWGP